MAKVIRHGKTPQWGTFDSGISSSSFILDSYNVSAEVKEYEQLNQYGQVKGYMIYDQTLSFDISGTLLAVMASATSPQDGGESLDYKDANSEATSQIKVGAEFVGSIIPIISNSDINNPTTAIIKSVSINTAQGSAWTFSASGTIYDLTDN